MVLDVQHIVNVGLGKAHKACWAVAVINILIPFVSENARENDGRLARLEIGNA